MIFRPGSFFSVRKTLILRFVENTFQKHRTKYLISLKHNEYKETELHAAHRDDVCVVRHDRFRDEPVFTDGGDRQESVRCLELRRPAR